MCVRERVRVWVSVGRSRSPMSKCSKVGVDGGKVRTSWDGDEKPGTPEMDQAEVWGWK